MNELVNAASYSFEIDEANAGVRLDRALSRLLPEVSRSRIQALLRNGEVLLNGQACGVRDVAIIGDVVELTVPPVKAVHDAPEAIPVDVIHEDASVIVINKPPGRVVHPGAGNRHGTLLNALLHRFPELDAVPRAGIVHRLDKDTSGVMVVARTTAAHLYMVDRLKTHDVSREYIALVRGQLTGGGTVNEPLGRHPQQRTRMAVRHDGRESVTHYRLAERFPSHTLLNVSLETGRTHQIRVHMAHIRHPVVGDPVYAGRAREVAGATDALRQALNGFSRQALHAAQLSFDHPDSGEPVCYAAPLPDDIAMLLNVLRRDAAERAVKPAGR